ncbi:hypothetical protein Scep_010151 [Stephania cephalantha]|uniref:Uncharacterized protein n=1 Tax=Stephania cephalantha TaxID=152367 RepID=A0AAP0PGT2_9MAGN
MAAEESSRAMACGRKRPSSHEEDCGGDSGAAAARRSPSCDGANPSCEQWRVPSRGVSRSGSGGAGPSNASVARCESSGSAVRAARRSAVKGKGKRGGQVKQWRRRVRQWRRGVQAMATSARRGDRNDGAQGPRLAYPASRGAADLGGGGSDARRI